MNNSLPSKALFCPHPEAHETRSDKILCAFSDDALFLRCGAGHEWVRVEIKTADGESVRFEHARFIVSDILHNKEKSLHFTLESVPMIAKGIFPIRKRRSPQCHK